MTQTQFGNWINPCKIHTSKGIWTKINLNLANLNCDSVKTVGLDSGFFPPSCSPSRVSGVKWALINSSTMSCMITGMVTIF